ncbi:MAG: alpha-ketoglutarate-dependent dioxygenase AlkB [Sandaracinaceae bacterium]|nr:MAG: alpha-ketoglutarate-dependent dioxygenase AlkB [Sandaracinaceae bacterium]HBQ19660.1 alpha-ketoglutarate-dependent dioxygenase AlkB [Myxococcales bacterium]
MQTSLFGHDAPEIDLAFHRVERIQLDRESWIDRQPGWVSGHARLFETLREAMRWHAQERPMYDRVVAVPRLLSVVPRDGAHPLLDAMSRALSRRYGEPLSSIMLALYRDGRDSVAWHADKELRDQPTSTVAVVSLGSPRKFMVRPAEGGASRSWSVGWGDLMVMGGACQRLWHHAVPKQRHAEPRMALMFRIHRPSVRA